MQSDHGHFEEDRLDKVYDLRLLRRLYPYARPYRLFLSGVIALVLLITLMELSLPYITKMTIDRYILPTVEIADANGVVGRFLRVDAAAPPAAAVVARHPGFFRTEGRSALIAYSDLPRLDRAERLALRGADLVGVGWMSLFFLVIVLLNFGLNFLQQTIMEYTGQMTMHGLRVRLFRHIQRLPVAFFNRNPVGRLVTRVTNDVQNMHELFTSVIAFFFKDLFLLLGIAAVLVATDWKLALAAFAVLPLVGVAGGRFARQAREVFRTLRIQVAEINTRFAETIGGIKVVQLYGHQQRNFERFARLNHENYLAGMRQIQVLAVFMPLVEFLGLVTVATVIYYGGSGVLAGQISLGALVAFIYYLRMFFRPMRDIADKFNILQNAMASAERIFLILDNADGEAPPAAAPAAVGPMAGAASRLKIRSLAMEQVSFGYVPHEPVLQGISFALNAGETLAVVGPTGSGKTTLINLVVRFYTPTAGRILVNGGDVRDLPPGPLRQAMALVMQDPFLFSETVRYNIFQDRSDLSSGALRAVLAAAHCDTIVERLPQGLDTVLSEGGASLSSGQRQLISIARAFARDPSLIILDEATSYVDSETEQKIQSALANLMKNRTAIVVAHRLTTARSADRILVLRDGRIIESGTHEHLMRQAGFYFQLNQAESTDA
ncbi:MAG: ABC transporter ATP-binding protein [Desulfobacterales bacterium]